ncbi:MAG: quinolinate synthase NadA [Hadesarchaea archaeon]|nr:quinolinate synthase NadA [Hadesarchaea archaeon]MDH5685163.1 quinolinate synthase NadA [Hadesarchaea archaeon]
MKPEQLKEAILKLKSERNAIILAHNYQREEVQLLGDYIGDSLDLARYSARVDADLILFCGVDFMAETAAILNPDKTVLIPDPEARCPMAAQLPAQLVREAKREHPGAAVVLYVNTLAEARAEADVTCTSANAPLIVNALDEGEILFGPDRNLAWFVQQRSDKKIIPLPDLGYCYVHRMFSPADITLLKKHYPDAEVLVHPECDPEVQNLASHICSTSQMLLRAKASPAKRFIIATEVGLVERLRREFPDKEFIPALETAVCEQMKKHTLEKLYLALRDKKHVVRVPAKIATKARVATERMLEISGRATHD